MLERLLISIGPALLTTAAAAVGFVVKDWQQRRSRDQLYKTALARATDHVTFLRSWLDAQSHISDEDVLASARDRAQNELDEVYSRLAGVVAGVREETNDLSFIQRTFLAYHLSSTGGRWARRGFYAWLLVLMLWIAGLSDDPTMTGLEEARSVLGQMLFVVIPLFLIHGVATVSESMHRRGRG